MATTELVGLLDNSFGSGVNNYIRFFDADGNRMSSEDIALPVGNWQGGCSVPNGFRILNGTTLVLYNYSGVLLSSGNFSILSGTWSGLVPVPGQGIQIVPQSNATFPRYSYDGTRVTSTETSLSGFYQGGTSDDTRLYVVQNASGSGHARAYDFSLNRQSAQDIALGTGSWRGGFRTTTRKHFINNTTNMTAAYDFSNVRQSGDDIDFSGIVRSNGGVTGGFAFVRITRDSAWTSLVVQNVSPTAPVWSTIVPGTWTTSTSSALNLNNFVTGATPITITHRSGLVPGLTLVNGIISGNPVNGIDNNVTVRATNSVGNSDTTFLLTITATGAVVHNSIPSNIRTSSTHVSFNIIDYTENADSFRLDSINYSPSTIYGSNADWASFQTGVHNALVSGTHPGPDNSGRYFDVGTVTATFNYTVLQGTTDASSRSTTITLTG